MKRVYIIKTVNLENPMEYGYMKEPANISAKSRVKTFRSKRLARIYLKLVRENLKPNWAHIVMPAYINETRSDFIADKIQLGGSNE